MYTVMWVVLVGLDLGLKYVCKKLLKTCTVKKLWAPSLLHPILLKSDSRQAAYTTDSIQKILIQKKSIYAWPHVV